MLLPFRHRPLTYLYDIRGSPALKFTSAATIITPAGNRLAEVNRKAAKVISIPAKVHTMFTSADKHLTSAAVIITLAGTVPAEVTRGAAKVPKHPAMVNKAAASVKIDPAEVITTAAKVIITAACAPEVRPENRDVLPTEKRGCIDPSLFLTILY